MSRSWASTTCPSRTSSTRPSPPCASPTTRWAAGRRGSCWSASRPTARRREAGDHLAAVGRHHELLLDPRRRPAVGGRPEGLEREHHPLLDRLGMVERHEPADDRLLPDREADAVAELQRERRLL